MRRMQCARELGSATTLARVHCGAAASYCYAAATLLRRTSIYCRLPAAICSGRRSHCVLRLVPRHQRGALGASRISSGVSLREVGAAGSIGWIAYVHDADQQKMEATMESMHKPRQLAGGGEEEEEEAE